MARTGERPTVRDVARRAGVSAQTVSRVVNGSTLVSAVTARRVQRVIAEVGYQTNMTARALSLGRGDVVGVLTHASLDHGPTASLFSIERAAQGHGLAITVAALHTFEAAAVQRAVDRLQQLGCLGIVMVAPWASDAAALDAISCEVPIVSTDMVAGFVGACVYHDQVHGSRAAVQHLLELGHKSVVHIAGAPGWVATDQRIDGWRQAHLAVAAPLSPPLLGDWSSRRGYELEAELPAGTTAVFTANDQTALGLTAALQRRGVRIPDDISIVGYDDIPDAPYIGPGLSTVASTSAGEKLVSTLLALVLDQSGSRSAPGPAPTQQPPPAQQPISPAPPPQILLPTRLVLRRSTAPPPSISV